MNDDFIPSLFLSTDNDDKLPPTLIYQKYGISIYVMSDIITIFPAHNDNSNTYRIFRKAERMYKEWIRNNDGFLVNENTIVIVRIMAGKLYIANFNKDRYLRYLTTINIMR